MLIKSAVQYGKDAGITSTMSQGIAAASKQIAETVGQISGAI